MQKETDIKMVRRDVLPGTVKRVRQLFFAWRQFACVRSTHKLDIRSKSFAERDAPHRVYPWHEGLGMST